MRETDDGRHRLEAAFRPRGGRQSDELQTLTVDAIINATGPEADYDRNPDPLVVNLRARGLLRPDRHRMGVDVDDNTGALRDAAGRPSPFLFTLGSPRRGSLYETIAVAEIRAQAAALVAAWLAQDNDNAPDPEPFGPVQRFSPTDDSVRLVRLPR